MTARWPPILSATTPGVAVSRRLSISVLASAIRNPLNAIPAEAFHEKLVYSRLAGMTRIHITDPELVHEALVVNAGALVKGPGAGPGPRLPAADGAHRRQQRQAMAAILHTDSLQAYLPRMIAAAEATRDRWLSWPKERVVDIGSEMRHTAFEIIAATMLSDRGDVGSTERFERCVGDCSRPTRWMLASSLLAVPEWLPCPGRRKARSAMALLKAEFARTIAARRHGPTGHGDLLERLMSAVNSENRRALTDQELIDHLFILISAGHGATALALAWVFCLLCRHPDVEARILEEIETLCGDGPVRAEHIQSLSWTRQVIQEAMRLYPPVPIVARTVGHSFRLDDFALSAGTVIHVPIYAIHRHSRLWERPGDFDPTRFSTEACKDRHRCAYMPFGAGPRVCIGAAFAMMETTAVLAVLLKSVRIRMSKAGLEPTPMARGTLGPAEPLWMSVSSREP